MEPYQALANAIVITAAKDYRAALMVKKNNPMNDAIKKQVSRLEEFFSSDWYETLTKVPGDYIAGKIREEVGCI